jgi:integral membrane protein
MPMAGALTRFRIMAYVVGVVLIILTIGMVLKYGFDEPIVVEAIGPIHGFLYVLYLLTVIDLALKAKFSIVKTLLVMLAGTVPFLSFVAEHIVVRDVKAGQMAQPTQTATGGS